MKFARIEARLEAIEPQEDLGELERDRLIAEMLQQYFLEHIVQLGLPHLVEEFRESLKTIGPRPFGHDRRDDRSMSMCIDDVAGNHRELAYRIRAAESLALADVLLATGSTEDDVQHIREYASEDLAQEAKEKQTTCDRCGSDLTKWHCYTFDDGKMVKICRACS
jgi:hypothetical protein